MKTTLNVNIGSVAFTIDDDAYKALKEYLDAVDRNLGPANNEALQEVEYRIAELLSERIHSPMRVVSIEDIERVRHQMGDPSAFATDGEVVDDNPTAPEGAPTPRPRLYRSRRNRSIAGICGGLAAYFEADPTLIRLLTLLLILFGGMSILVYVILWIIIPEEPVQPINLHK